MKRFTVLVLLVVGLISSGCTGYYGIGPAPYPWQYQPNYPPQYQSQYPQEYFHQYSTGYSAQYQNQYSVNDPSSLFTQPLIVRVEGNQVGIDSYGKLTCLLKGMPQKVYTFMLERQYTDSYHNNVTLIFESLGYELLESEPIELRIIAPSKKDKNTMEVVKTDHFYRQLFVLVNRNSAYTLQQQCVDAQQRYKQRDRYRQEQRYRQEGYQDWKIEDAPKAEIKQERKSSGKPRLQQKAKNPTNQSYKDNSALYRQMQKMGVAD